MAEAMWNRPTVRELWPPVVGPIRLLPFLQAQTVMLPVAQPQVRAGLAVPPEAEEGAAHPWL